VTREESLELLQLRWPAVEQVVAHYNRDASAAVQRDGLVVHLTALSAERPSPEGEMQRDRYVFRLTFADYDDHAARIVLCNPDDPSVIGTGKQFYPRIEGNNVFVHDTFFCMPGERRCYEQGNHPEWKDRQHYHPDIVIGCLLELIRSPGYRGRL
jgi:hypothetical protein